ncbi:MAG: hypothetical protein JWL60_2659 [Gemmatimonadetes bacterium]|jgi:uncharacterized protein (DUF488 family)|nr:hypothetical protein [Gemmatimonadota bacterium]
MTTPATVWTIGHSTRGSDELCGVLAAHRIQLVADVRRFPGSRRHPHLAPGQLGPSLAGQDIDYRWIPELGGRRRALPDSPNTGWRHPAFRGYADHMGTGEFADGLYELLMLAHGQRTAVMCAEVLWWRCHRRLVADLLVSMGLGVVHVQDAVRAEPHRIAPPARLVRGTLSYAAG